MHYIHLPLFLPKYFKIYLPPSTSCPLDFSFGL